MHNNHETACAGRWIPMPPRGMVTVIPMRPEAHEDEEDRPKQHDQSKDDTQIMEALDDLLPGYWAEL